ncbi:MAG TPA: CDP-alcohol phosphatidyltransferase family protein [Thermoanaerobaculia bacterium]|nr:CDP-alcohol phosphatidyltransferase family protein [Thermoanaerobaculia bacterium]
MAFTVPNLLSILRMGLVPLFIIVMTRGEVGKALVIFAVAGVTDALDGFIARFFDQQSLLGSYLDPAADKLLLTSAYVLLTLEGVNPQLTIPLWVTVLVIGRDVLLLVTAASLYVALDIRRFPPSWMGKLTTVVQVAAVVLVLAYLVRPYGWLGEVAEVLIYAVALATVLSGVTYVFRANRQVGEARQEGGPQPPSP